LIAMGFEAKTTGKRIADIRGKNNMSQEKLAETLSKSAMVGLLLAKKLSPPAGVVRTGNQCGVFISRKRGRKIPPAGVPPAEGKRRYHV